MKKISSKEIKILNAFNRLEQYCKEEDYRGYDPYDGLNSSFFQSLSALTDNRLCRLAWIQAFKRLPINLRPILGVKKDYNPKALGLFISGYCALYKTTPKPEYLHTIESFIEKLLLIKSVGWSGNCWGYNFDWQARAFFQPKYTPTVVATTYVANALLDFYEILGEQDLLTHARSSCDFVLKDLNRTNEPDGSFCFSYSPLDHSAVFNASLLASKLLARVYSYTGERELLDAAKKSLDYCCNRQKEDGSWAYGTYRYHQWIDNFHTGFNLECIADYMKYSGDLEYSKNLDQGYRFYTDHFFLEDGRAKYYHNKIYPIDIHAPAQMIITASSLGKLDSDQNIINQVMDWTLAHMQDQKGYFYYQIRKYYRSKIPYMRWAQAWMFYALSKYIVHVMPAAISEKQKSTITT